MVFPVSLPYPLSLVAVSSAISFRLPPASISAAASSGSPLTSLSIHRSLGLTFHGLSPLSINFLTPAVFAFFRPLQFWVLTTQPLFLPFRSSHFRLTVASMLYPSALAFRFSIFRSAWFPMLHFRLPVLSSSVCFLLPYPASLPQLFHRCFPDLPVSFVPFFSGLFHFRSAFFRLLPFRFRLLSLSALPFFLFPDLPCSCLSGALPFLSSRSPSPSIPSGFPSVLSGSFTQDSVCFLSSFPVSLPQPFHRCSPSLSLQRFPLLPLSFVRFRFRFLTTQPLFLPFNFFPFPPHSCFLGVSVFLSSHSFSPYSLPGFPCILSGSV